MLLKRSKARQQLVEYVDKPFSWKKKAAILLLLGATAVSVLSGSMRSETWRGIEAALLFLLPWWTWKQYKAYSRSSVDMSAIEVGLGSKRWAFENLLSILHVLLIAVETVSFVVGAFRGEERSKQTTWDQLLTLAFLVIDFVVVLYSAVLSRVLGDFSDPAALVPRTARPELRPPRYSSYLTSLNRKMITIRTWWLLRGLLITIAGFSKFGLAVKQQFFPSGFGAASFWPTWEQVTSLPTSDPSFALAHPFLAFYSSTGIASLVHRIGSVLYSSLLRDHLGSPSPLTPESIAFNFNLARAVMAALSATVLPLALALLASYSLCKWSALDYAVHRQDEATKGEMGELQWETASIGVHPCQVLPTRIVAAANITTGSEEGDEASNTGAGAGGAAAAPSRRAGAAASSSSSSSSSSASADASASTTGSKYATPLLHYLYEGTLPSSSTALSVQQQGLTPRQASVVSSLPPVMSPVPRRFPDSTLLLNPRPMRVVILTIGTRGDVQPYVALALGLKEAGHDVTISSTSDFKAFVEGYGLKFHDTKEPRIVQPEEWLRINSVAEMITVSAPHIKGSYDNVSKEFYSACVSPRPADVIIGTAMTVSFALSISEAISVPCWISKLAPEIPSKGFVTPGSKESSIGWLNMLKCIKYWLQVANASTAAGLQRCEDAFRSHVLGIQPVQASRRIAEMTYTPQILAFSKHLFPRPADYPPWCFQVGFWATSEAEQFHQKAEARLRYFMEGYAVGGVLSSSTDDSTTNASAAAAAAPKSAKKPSRSSAAAVAAAATYVDREADPDVLAFAASVDADPSHDNLPKVLRFLKLSREERDEERDHQEGSQNHYTAQHRVAVITFGSMVLASNTPSPSDSSSSSSLIEDIVHELLDARYQVLILTGWVSKAPLHPVLLRNRRVLCIKEAPHDWVFSKASLVVHHGGAGTTGRALSCGVPSLIIPVLRWADQMQWGRIVEARGVGVLVEEANPTRDHIRRAISKLKVGTPETAHFTHSLIGDKANRLGSFVRAETSVESSVALLESCLCNLVLTPEQADAIHPLNSWSADPLKIREGQLASNAFDVALSPEQEMCVRNCIPCRRVRAQLALGDTSLFRIALPPYNGGVVKAPMTGAAAAAAAAAALQGGVMITFTEGSPFLEPFLGGKGKAAAAASKAAAAAAVADEAASASAPVAAAAKGKAAKAKTAAAPASAKKAAAAAASKSKKKEVESEDESSEEEEESEEEEDIAPVKAAAARRSNKRANSPAASASSSAAGTTRRRTVAKK